MAFKFFVGVFIGAFLIGAWRGLTRLGFPKSMFSTAFICFVARFSKRL